LPDLSRGSCRAAAGENIKRKNDQRSEQQQVNQVGGNKATHKPKCPQQQQHYQIIYNMIVFSLISKTLSDLQSLDIARQPQWAK